MDVGLVVGNVGYLAALFAGLSALALAVQLGEPPASDKGKQKKREGGSHAKEQASSEQDLTFNAEGKLVANELTSNKEISLSDLTMTFVDGFSGPRSKYDIALTILHEIQNDAGTSDSGSTMAAEAYLDATQSILFSEQSEPLLALRGGSEQPRRQVQREATKSKRATRESREKPASKIGDGSLSPSNSSMRRPNPRKSRNDASDPEQE